jgi:hypothetical protein
VNYIIAFPAEIQAMQMLEPYGYARILPRPEGQSWDDYAWNPSNGMIGGTKIVLDYTDGVRIGPGGQEVQIKVPVYESTYFWCSLIARQEDGDLWARFSGQPIIEIDPSAVGDKPSDFVIRSAHLSFDIDAIAGPITPVWAGMPDMGFRGPV